MLEYLANYRISVLRELLDAINSDMLYIDNKIDTLYGTDVIRGVAPQITILDNHRPYYRIAIPDLL